jgi:hypothetical protein
MMDADDLENTTLPTTQPNDEATKRNHQHRDDDGTAI